MEKLGGMKARGADIAVLKNWFAIYFDPKGMRGIVDDFEAVLVRYGLYGLHIAGNAIDMGGENGACVRSDGGFDLCRVDGEITCQDIHIDGLATFPHDAAGGGHIRKRGSDDFAFEVQGFDGKLKGDGSIPNKKQVIQGKVFFELEFQLIDQRSIVSQPVALPDIV